jgi:putative ABC transport system substrate-binding protein
MTRTGRALTTLILGLGVFGLPLVAESQQARKVARIGFLGPTSSAAGQLENRLEDLRAGLREFGYVDGQNLVFEYRWAEGKYDRLPDLAAELVRLKVDVLVTTGTPGTRAAKQATTTIPIVMVNSGDAVATGLVASLARPGGNVTGTTFFVPELMAKRLELLKEVMPRARRVGVLVNADDPSHVPVVKAMEIAAGALNVGLQTFGVRAPNDFESTLAAMTKSRIDAIVVQEDALLGANARVIADLAAKKHLPSAGNPVFAEAGGQIGYGVHPSAMWRRAAYFVDRILKGAKPGDLPIERPTKFDLVVNLETAKTLGLTIPPAVLARADKVIQ